jgi:hypothetical protein
MNYTTQKVLQTKYTVIIVFKAPQKSKKKIAEKEISGYRVFCGRYECSSITLYTFTV